jgi:hypothetical protein
MGFFLKWGTYRRCEVSPRLGVVIFLPHLAKVQSWTRSLLSARRSWSLLHHDHVQSQPQPGHTSAAYKEDLDRLDQFLQRTDLLPFPSFFTPSHLCKEPSHARAPLLGGGGPSCSYAQSPQARTRAHLPSADLKRFWRKSCPNFPVAPMRRSQERGERRSEGVRGGVGSLGQSFLPVLARQWSPRWGEPEVF